MSAHSEFSTWLSTVSTGPHLDERRKEVEGTFAHAVVTELNCTCRSVNLRNQLWTTERRPCGKAPPHCGGVQRRGRLIAWGEEMAKMNWNRVATEARTAKYGTQAFDGSDTPKSNFGRRKSRRVNFTRRLTREEELAHIAAFTPKPKP